MKTARLINNLFFVMGVIFLILTLVTKNLAGLSPTVVSFVFYFINRKQIKEIEEWRKKNE